MTEPAFETPMKVEDARSILWPFKEYKGRPIGELLKSRLITLRDLSYAFEHSYDKRLREATHTLILHIVSQKTEHKPGAKALNVVKSERRSFSERKQLQFSILRGMIAGVIFGVVMGWLLTYTSLRSARSQADSPVQEYEPIFLIIAVLIMTIAIGLVYYVPMKIVDIIDRYLEKHVERYRKGQLGEERIENILRQMLDGQWWLFRNLELPRQKRGDVDMVLVGPSGIWAIEVKNLDGDYRNIGDAWEIRQKGAWHNARLDASRQARSKAALIGNTLKIEHIAQWVNPVVVWANPANNLEAQTPSVPVWKLSDIACEVEFIQNRKPMDPQKLKEIIQFMQSLYTSDEIGESQQA